MVYVNSKKFACESCIKGHRSSSCHHTDRPLFEIKKKGRPVSQCEKCRELRQSKRVHSKCTCLPKAEQRSTESSIHGTKSRRFIPIVPALPNGLRDVFKQSESSASSSYSRQRVDSLLNPCTCNDVLKCKCKVSASSSPDVFPEQGEVGLVTLAHAAAAISGHHAGNSPRPRAAKRHPSRPASPSQFSSPSSSSTSAKRTKLDKFHHHHHSHPHHHHVSLTPSPGPELPPLLFGGKDSFTHPSTQSLPDFPIMPPLSAIASLAGSGCTCGLHCACPGCVEHRGPEHTAPNHKDCADGCGHCIDPSTANIDLSYQSAVASTSTSPSPPSTSPNPVFNPPSSVFDEFFARAASLPAPPMRKRSGDVLDSSSLAIPPTDLTMMGIGAEKAAFGFGFVTLPKLECCRGSCGCPPGRCQCVKSCGGCCDSGSDKQASRGNDVRSFEEGRLGHGNDRQDHARVIAPARGCCAGRRASAAVVT